MTKRRRQAGSRGFTLLEVLLAMTMLAVLSVILFGGLRFGARVWEGGSRTLAIVEETHAVQMALRRMVGDARLPRAGGAGTPAQALFDGTPEALTFVGLPPAPVMVGAFYRMRVAVAREADALHLVLSWTFFDAMTENTAPFADAAHRILLQDIAAVRIDYFGAEDREAEPAWLPEWRGVDRLPQLVRIQVDFPPQSGRSWPELIVAVRRGGERF